MIQPVLEFSHIDKAFFGVPVLTDVCLALAAGSILGLVGENGAGKSTLLNILGGILPADAGQLRIDGKPFQPARAADSSDARIAMVHQELNLFGNLSVAENLSLAELPCKRWAGLRWVDRGTLAARATSLLGKVGFEADPDTLVERLSPGERQMVEIAKALRGNPRILVFDEPTTSLTRPEAERLFSIIGQLRAEGKSIIYVSHNLEDVLRICDQIAVLRDGRVQASGPAGQFDVGRMIHQMVGRDLDGLFPRHQASRSNEVVLEVRRLSQSGVVNNIQFKLHRGELLGISGLMGSGRTELARILFGLDRYEQGEIILHGRPLPQPRPARCIRRGMALLTEDRRQEGLLMEGSVTENIAFASLRRFASGPFAWLHAKRLDQQTFELTRRLSIDCREIRHQPVRTLSGGNQQKVVLAKWLLRGSDVLILDEPTRGVDVGARHEIYVQINRMVERGAGVLLISSEMEELVGLCDRILVMARGEIISAEERENFDRREILQSAFGKERLS